MTLRPYQRDAVDAAIQWMKKTVEPGLLELAAGSGKSHCVAAIAEWVYSTSGKRVLCLQPTKELTTQNHQKYLNTGNPASIFSASAGSKCMRHPVVYGTPGTVKNSLSRFGDQFGAVVIDEAHGITPTIRKIVKAIKKANPLLRVIGMTASPYRTGSGYIYRYNISGEFIDESKARAPWFNTLLYQIGARDLIEMGFLTNVYADMDDKKEYDTSGLKLNSRGQFDHADIEKVFEGWGRETSQIVADVVARSAGHTGVMIFAATVQHAKEIMASLPPDNSMMLGGDVNMEKSARDDLIQRFKEQKFKYIVSVGTLTTGVDFPHVSVIAVLRATESPGLYQQIIGRGTRLYPGKTSCLLLDYAQNILRHELQSDLFDPKIEVKKASGGSDVIDAKCPDSDCGFVNQFSARPNDAGYDINETGYFVDINGLEITNEDGIPIPAHFGRRCNGQVKSVENIGEYERCEYRWSFKECPDCEGENDIAARYCSGCKFELVDPNEKLEIEFTKAKKDPYTISTDEVLEWFARKSVSRAGNEMLVCDYKTEYRTFTYWYTPGVASVKAVESWEMLSRAVFKGHIAPDVDTFLEYLPKGRQPETVTYAKQRGSKFTNIYAYNRPVDEVRRAD